jgi:hypothetical protein
MGGKKCGWVLYFAGILCDSAVSDHIGYMWGVYYFCI